MEKRVIIYTALNPVWHRVRKMENVKFIAYPGWKWMVSGDFMLHVRANRWERICMFFERLLRGDF